jgi:hypothetical protein
MTGSCVSSVAGSVLLLVYASYCIAAHPMLAVSAAIAACAGGLWFCFSSCAALRLSCCTIRAITQSIIAWLLPSAYSCYAAWCLKLAAS